MRVSANKTMYEIVKRPAYIRLQNTFDLGFFDNWQSLLDGYKFEQTLYTNMAMKQGDWIDV